MKLIAKNLFTFSFLCFFYMFSVIFPKADPYVIGVGDRLVAAVAAAAAAAAAVAVVVR